MPTVRLRNIVAAIAMRFVVIAEDPVVLLDVGKLVGLVPQLAVLAVVWAPLWVTWQVECLHVCVVGVHVGLRVGCVWPLDWWMNNHPLKLLALGHPLKAMGVR